MKCEDVIKQLQAVLPTFTDLFTDNISVTSLTRVGTTVTCVTTIPNSLVTGNYVTIVSAVNQNPLVSLEVIDGYAHAETTINHDLTLVYNKTVLISGAVETEYNGEHELVEVKNRKEFVYKIDGAPSSPATGSPILNENFNYGYNGTHQITVVDTTTFTYETEFTPYSPAIGQITARHTARISGTIDIDSAGRSYTKQKYDNFWAYAVVGPAGINSSRNTNSDAYQTKTISTDYRHRVIQDFSVFVFAPAVGEIAARKIHDKMEDLLQPFCRSLLGVKFPSLLSDQQLYATTFLGHEAAAYNNAYYIHEFKFETVKDITFEDTTLPYNFNVAFRNIDINYISDIKDDVIMTSKIDLDEEPIT